MLAHDNRLRLLDAAQRVESRTGIDPLDVTRSMAVTTDARLELLPKSIGVGLAALAGAVALVCLRFLLEPASGPGVAATGVFVLVDVVLWVSVVACVAVARAARSRRPQNERYEDAWAQFAVEIWPAPRYQPWNGGRAQGSGYSRTEFLIAVRDGAALDAYLRRAPFTRMP